MKRFAAFGNFKVDPTWLAFVGSADLAKTRHLDTYDAAKVLGVTEADVFNARTLVDDTNAFVREANAKVIYLPTANQAA